MTDLPAPKGAEIPFDNIFPPPRILPDPLDVRVAIAAVLAAVANRPDDSITHDGPTACEPRPEALEADATCNRGVAERDAPACTPEPAQEAPRPPLQQPSPSAFHAVTGPRRPRDQEMLLLAFALRLVSFRQLHKYVFADQHLSSVGRRAEVLVQLGLAAVWEDRLPRGGHPRYLVPTREGMQWAHGELLARTRALDHGELVRQMMAGTSRTPLHLAAATAPGWLPHQREINALVTSFLRTPSLKAQWASAWHRPFPNTVDGLAMPQPDFVLVLRRGSDSILVFGEHDRGSEPVPTFRRAKAERYAALARFPDLLARLTGFRSFEVWTTVESAQPIARLQTLLDASRTTYGAPKMLFTCAQWALDAPDGAIWFDGAHRPAHELQQIEAHPNLQHAASASS